MTTSIVFDPALPMALIALLAVIAAAGVALAFWRGLSGWALRALAALVVIIALTTPSLQREEREALSDIVILLVDNTASQHLSDRAAQTSAAAQTLSARITALDNTELRRIDLPDGPGNTGTRAMAALSSALAQEPRARIAAVFLISDGRVHDMDAAPALSAPTHLLLTGQPDDWDRRLTIENAPAYAILGEEITLTLRIDDQGNTPAGQENTALEVSIDGAPPRTFQVPVGRAIDLPLSLPHGGLNLLRLSVPIADGELTGRNNSALVRINGVRDRLRVLLVSGEPHPGGRTWRNLLKSDSSVDLVHFTILRPPEKQDGVPVSELSLIAFPTRELFLEKIDDFDLIVFDRYKRRGILPALYLDNVRRYVEDGGAVLIAAGPDFAAADSLYRSPLSAIVPASPSARVIEQGYLPTITETGTRHPVTAGLQPPAGQENWGRWLRQIEVSAQSGDTVMSGVNDAPLLVLDRVGEGRIALLASDHAWLWSRGYEGGGPQSELLRRLAHWMMKEPELEEEALTAEQTGEGLLVRRRTLAPAAGPVSVTTPSGRELSLPMVQSAPGLFEARIPSTEVGLFTLTDQDMSAVAGLGPSAPREFLETIADGAVLEPLIGPTKGGIAALSDGLPNLRSVRAGRPAAGRGWLGITPRGAYQTSGIWQKPLLPHWLVLLISAFLITAAWLREGRR